MLSPERDIELQALSYLMTTVIHRLHEKDPAWWQETLKEIRAEKKALLHGAPGADIADHVLARAIGIVEHALAAEDSPSHKRKHGRGVQHDQ